MPFALVDPSTPVQHGEPALIFSKIFADDRGYFMELFKKSEIESLGIKESFPQDNLSFSVKNVLRGLHYQTNPKAQGKLVTCVKGEVMDVIVDIRKGSPNYGKWKSYILSEKNGHMLYVPTGFAHGFVTLSENAMFMYKCTDEYSPENDAGVIWNDPDLNIDWGVTNPILSPKDEIHPTLREAKNNFEYQRI